MNAITHPLAGTPRARHVRLGLSLLLVLLTAPILAQSGGGFDLTWNAVAGGGVTFMTGGGFTLGSTVGQHDAAVQSGGGITLTSGFWAATTGVGVSALSPSTGSSAAGMPTTITLTWTHPEQWRDLQKLDLRLCDRPCAMGGTPLVWLRFSERHTAAGADASVFQLLDAQGAVVGSCRAGAACAPLQTADATFYPAASAFSAAGPSAPSVTLTFVLSFKLAAKGRTYAIELLGER